ncbi:hypothetical protein JCM10450v2_001428 [Rhodotorula kratochvilovae]
MAHPAAAASLRLEAVQAHAADQSEFITFRATMRLPISPRFASKGDTAYPGHDGGMDGVREVLAGWVMRYLPPIRAVLLSFSPTPRFLHPAASFPASASPFDSLPLHVNPLKDPRGLLSSPQPGGAEDAAEEETETIRLKTLPMIQGTGFTLANVEWEGVGWRPRVGMKLLGTLTLASPSHVSLLLHNLFNASIPVSHIPTSEWEFDADCAVPPIVLERRNAAVPLKSVVDSVVNAAEKATGATEEAGVELEPTGEEAEADAAKEEADEEDVKEEDEEEQEEEELYAERGWWVHRVTREPLGGSDGRIQFTLVDLTTTNSLLSCTGSLLADPFAPAALAALSAHRPAPNAAASLVKSTVLSKKKRARDSDTDTGSSASDESDEESDSEVDNDDDDGVGTGIPRHGVEASKGVPQVRAASSAGSESSRSPSPLPPPAEVAKPKKEKKEVKAKKEKKAAKEEKPARKSKKVKAER